MNLEWFHVAEDGDQWQDFVNMVMKSPGSIRSREWLCQHIITKTGIVGQFLESNYNAPH
jgi:hypothetical protein